VSLGDAVHYPRLTQPSTYPIKEDFLRAAESQGIPVCDDLQDLTTGHGAEHWLKWINRDVSIVALGSLPRGD
jgi:hypothetical protein